jgi:hypothetical protein
MAACQAAFDGVAKSPPLYVSSKANQSKDF